MKSVERSLSARKRMKILVLLPLVIIPLVTITFWFFGGGSNDPNVEEPKGNDTLQTALPSPNLPEEKDQSKLAFYDRADQANLKQQQKNSFSGFSFDTNVQSFYSEIEKSVHNNLLSSHGFLDRDPAEQKVYEKLAQINQQFSNPSRGSAFPANVSKQSGFSHRERSEYPQLDNLSDIKEDGDHEFDHIDSVMEKILDIQHPERVSERNTQLRRKNESTSPPTFKSEGLASISVLEPDLGLPRSISGFFSVEEAPDTNFKNAIRAVVTETQSLINGSTIKLRTLDDMVVAGHHINHGVLLFGSVSLEGERLHVSVKSFRLDDSVIPIKLTLFDFDGLEGISIPDALSRDVAKSSMNDATQMLNLSSLDPSFKIKLAGAGIEAAKKLLSKKTKLARALVREGYEVLLVNDIDQF